MEFLFAKIFEEYIRRKDGFPQFGIVAYISVIYLLIAFTLLLPIQLYLENQLGIKISRTGLQIVYFGLVPFLFFIVYLIYIRNRRIHLLTEKYRNVKLNRVL